MLEMTSFYIGNWIKSFSAQNPCHHYKGVCFAQMLYEMFAISWLQTGNADKKKKRHSPWLEKCKFLIPTPLNPSIGLFEHFQTTPAIHLLCILLDNSCSKEKQRNYCRNQKHNPYLCWHIQFMTALNILSESQFFENTFSVKTQQTS